MKGNEHRRIRTKQLSSAELTRIANFLQRCGARIALLEVHADGLKITTTDSTPIEMTDEGELDAELEAFRKTRG